MLGADRKYFNIRFRAGEEVFGKEACGSPFSVYAPGRYRSAGRPDAFERVRTWAYGVKAGDQLEDQWPLDDFENSRYHLRVYGPNGFFREFRGAATDPLLEATCEYEPVPGTAKHFSGNISLVIKNMDDRAYTLEITDNAYKAPPVIKTVQKKGDTGDRVVISQDLSRNHGWYDFSLKIQGSGAFEKRWAGRVETGKHGYSDPFMGRML
jgi:phospholipase C